MIIDLTLNNGKNSSAIVIEKEFERTRSKYLKDLDKLRKRYARQFLKISRNYNDVFAALQQ